MSFMKNFENALNELRESEGKSAVTVSNGKTGKVGGTSGSSVAWGTGSSTGSTSKKKKKNSFMDNFYEELNKLQDEDDDIAPIGSTVAERVEARANGGKKKEQDKGWFQKGAFDDGYDFGDITKVILGTGADVLEDLGAGIAEMPEKFADAAAMIAPYYAQSQINQAAYSTMNTDLLKASKEYDLKEEKKKADEFVAKDLYDGAEIAHGILNPVTDGVSAMIGQDYETASALGEKADYLVQSGGQLLATAGLQAVGVPWFLTTGVTTFGAESENALNQGASHEQAMGSAAISAASEILTEKLSGGIKFGGKVADDFITDRIARGIANKLGRTLTRVGVDAAGESFEELLSEAAGKVGSSLYREESLWEILSNEEALDDYLDAMIGGGLLGGVSGGTKAVNSTRKGIDYVSGLTKNEQKVVDKVYKDRLAEEQKKGKVTEKQKDAIYEKVLSDMDKGYITSDTIEEVLGGDAYNSYLNLKAEADEYNTLYETESGKLSDKQKDRLAELKEKNKAKSYEDALKEAQGQLSESVFSLVKGDRLVESYNERSRRGQAFEADLTQYDAKQQEVIKRAVDSGILNNTHRTHEFVDMVAKISADKGVLFDFTNNQKLKESGFAVEGKQVNGYVTKDGITLNIDSPKAMESTVGHEITHVLEGTEFYDALKQTLFDYAKTKGEYQTRYDSLAELYKDVKDADIDKELAADLVGDYLFSDPDFIKNLSTQNRNVFQKIYDEIKYLCKVVTAGSKEARELERVKKAFEDAYRAEGKKQDGTQYSVSETTDGRFVAVVDNDILSHLDTSKLDKETKKAAKKAANEELKKFKDGFTINGVEFVGNKDSRDEYIRSDYSEALARKNPEAYLDKMRATSVLDDVVRVATDWSRDGYLKYDRDDYVDFIRGKTLIKSGDRTYRAVVLAGITDTGEVQFHDVDDIYSESFEIKESELSTAVSTNESSNAILESSDTDTLAEKGENVNYSLSDSNGKELTKEQQEFFKDSGVSEDQSVKALDSDSVTKYSLSTWTPEMQTKVSENLVKAGFEKTDVDKWIQDTNSIAAVIAKDKERLDFEAHENHTMVKDNLDYYKTVEASTLCAKRLKYQGTFDAIQHKLPNTTLTSDMLIELREMMKKNGHEVPCGACYVESRRRHLGKYATDWLKTYDAEFIPTLADVTTTDGLEKLRTEHPQTYKDFVDAMNKKGVANPKVVELRTEYNGEIMNISNAVYKKIMKIGGLRLQSFSDFETPHLLDMMQVVNDMASRKFVSQAYTKVPNFAWVLGDTNIKINLSLIPGGTGVDANGELIFDPKEGMPIEDAMQLRDRYSKNVGTTIIGINDEHILKCMADDRIDYIIPFHRSGWGAKELSAMGLDSYVDYTKQQKERDIKTGKGVPNIDEMSYWDFNKSGKENAEAYLALCAEKGVIPKFDKFLVNNGDGSYSLQPDGSTDGYWKTLINFKMYDNDGVGSPHQAVVPNFNMEEAYRVLNEYEGGANSLPVADDVVEEFVAKYNEAVAPVRSLSAEGETPVRPNYRATMGEDIALQDIAPTAEDSTVVAENATTTQEAPIYESDDKTAPEGQTAMFESVEEAHKRLTRKELHQNIVEDIRARFKEKGFDFDKVLKKARNLSTWSTVDNTPQRVMEKALGYKEGGVLADITVNQAAQNEAEGIKWVNKNVKLLRDISKQYHIKPGSKESAAAQMYAEGFYVNENNEIVRYGDPELIQDFKNPEVRRNIKALARDPRIRKIYDDALALINESRTRNAYPEIPRLDNYFLHFRAMTDTFSTLGLPFNPNDIRAKDLPTDLNGVTADLKPGQPYFASAMHRKGKRTSFDLLGGIERYLNSAKNQIYHIDDIQTLRALRNYIAETYGQATGLEDIDTMSDAEAEERIKQVYGAHLSTFAKFLNEEANVLAGKTALIDRGLEGIIGRRGITFLNTLNQQVGSNMVGYNVSSSLTNFLPVAQTFAKTNKFDFAKAFVQTVANKFSGGRFDSFAEDSPVVIRRKGSDRFYQTPWQKMANPGYVLMSAVDDISTELIARTKYNEFTRKGMDSQKAHFETDKWVSKLMGDRSLGQQPQLYNSKMLGLVTKFQLEVRNQLDSQFYDTIQETKASNEHIQNGLARNAMTAAKVASTFTQLAVAQHLFGKAFESVAGYNPAFDIIEVLMTAFGFDDDEESEDTVLDNLEQGFFALLEDLPYASTFTGGGRIPISSALPIGELVKGEDKYGNEKSRWETIGEIAPYYLMPAGYGQIKKTVAGMKMFSDEHPIAGSYTDAGNLRFPVEDTLANRIQAGIFGQYASENARKYFDEEQRTLNPEQTEIFAGLDIPIEEYWEYRDNLYDFYDVKDQLKEAAYADGATDEDALRYRYISSVYNEIYDLYDQQKEIASGDGLFKQDKLREIQTQMSNMLTDSKSAVDNISISGAYAEVGDRRYNYDAEKDTWYEIKPKNSDGSDNWFYQKEQEVTEGLGISYEEYWNNREEYNYAYDKPGRYAIAQTVGGYDAYMEHYDVLENWQSDNYLRADKDSKGNSISGSRKKKVIEYINGLDADYGTKIILYRTVYSSKADKNAYNSEIIDYLNSRDDISYEQMKSILEELEMEVDSNGYITW